MISWLQQTWCETWSECTWLTSDGMRDESLAVADEFSSTHTYTHKESIIWPIAESGIYRWIAADTILSNSNNVITRIDSRSDAHDECAHLVITRCIMYLYIPEGQSSSMPTTNNDWTVRFRTFLCPPFESLIFAQRDFLGIVNITTQPSNLLVIRTTRHTLFY